MYDEPRLGASSIRNIRGRCALITGAAGGIGSATARLLADEGARLVLVDRDEAALAALRTELSAAEVLTLIADVAEEADVQHVASEAVKRFGGIDLLHNNAGILGDVGPLWELSAENFDRTMSVNVRSTFLFLKAFALDRLERGQPGAVVNMSSVAGINGSPGLAVYSATKQAILGLTRTAAHELGKHGIRVNAVYPGRVDTGMSKTFVTAPSTASRSADPMDTRPIPRLGTPDEIARLVVWLLSDEASFVTGAAYAIDGGMTS
jgi:NAD(P)-dependent dehydrogenase (short-subunit alcohol dehydrogenase family)